MTPEFKAKWIADLKSHEKIQGLLRGWVRDDTDCGGVVGYCCLGVACLTLGATFEAPEDCGELDARPILDGERLNDGEGLNLHALGLMGIREIDHTELIAINDKTDTFAEVIAYIEEHL
jgi:hypothetical protein